MKVVSSALSKAIVLEPSALMRRKAGPHRSRCSRGYAAASTIHHRPIDPGITPSPTAGGAG